MNEDAVRFFLHVSTLKRVEAGQHFRQTYNGDLRAPLCVELAAAGLIAPDNDNNYPMYTYTQLGIDFLKMMSV